jgi:hypothetical protein
MKADNTKPKMQLYLFADLLARFPLERHPVTIGILQAKELLAPGKTKSF